MAEHDADYGETTLSSHTMFQGRLLHVKADEVRLPNGKHAVREYIQHPGACMMLAFVDDETILLIRQYRYALRRHFIEVPAGKIDPGEDWLATAQRELVEECGYEAAEWRHLATMHPCIGYADEHIELYLARGLKPVPRALDHDEFIDVFPLKVPEALEWVRDGRITEAKAVTALLWADRIVRGEWR